MDQKLTFSNSRGDKLIGVLSNPTGDKTKPIVILVHGFNSKKETRSLVQLQEIFDKQDLSSFRFDLYGHGESEGEFENITVSEAVDDILRAIIFLKAEGYTRIGLVGSSFGGLASIIATSQTEGIFALALKAPVSDYEETRRLKIGEEGIEQWEKEGYAIYEGNGYEKLKLNYSFFENAGKNKAYTVAPSIKVPTLIVHGDQDKTVPIKQSIKTMKLLPKGELVTIKGASHSFEGEYWQQMLETISSFMIRHANSVSEK